MTSSFESNHTKEEIDNIIKNNLLINNITSSIIDNICSVPKKTIIPNNPNVKFYGPYKLHKNIELESASTQILNNSINSYCNVKDPYDRIQLLSELIFYDPNNFAVYYYIANAYLELNNLLVARTYHSISILLNKNNIASLTRLALIYQVLNPDYVDLIIKRIYDIEKNFINQELEQIKNTIFQFHKELDSLKLKLKLKSSIDYNAEYSKYYDNIDPKMIDITEKFLLSNLLSKESYNTSQLRSDPIHMDKNILNTIEYILSRGLIRIQSQNKELQRNSLLALLFYNPINYILLFNIGYTFQESNNIKSARSYYHMALVINPYHIDSLINLGTLYRISNPEFAIKILTKVSRLYPENYAVMNTLGVLYNDIHNYMDLQ